jgi:hypothetical protein
MILVLQGDRVLVPGSSLYTSAKGYLAGRIFLYKYQLATQLDSQ